MLFKEVVGQEKIKSDCKQLSKSAKVPHALLFLGPEGSGNLAMALALAQFMLCEQPTSDDSCGRCSACLKASKLIHPDLHFTFPTMGRNVTSDALLSDWREALTNPYLSENDWLKKIAGEKGSLQGNINKEECVTIVKKLGLKPFESDIKIQIIWLPEYLGKEGNRLLKIIEEPPPNTYFFLVATNQELILNTILSRCQLVKLNLLSDEEILNGLLERNLVSEKETAKTFSAMAHGNFNEALNLASNQQNEDTKLFFDWLRKCYAGNGAELVKWSETLSDWNKDRQKHFFSYGFHFFRELFSMKVSHLESKRLTKEELQTANKLNSILETWQFPELISILEDCLSGFERNANSKLLLLDASIKMKQLLKKERIREENLLQFIH